MFPSLRDLPEPVDHAMVIVPGAAVPSVLEDAAARGVKSVTVYAAGIGDGESEDARRRGEALKQTVASTGLRVSGPNCMGGFSYREKFFAYPNSRLTQFGPGPVGCLFQSGGTLQFFMGTGGARGLKFS